MTKAEAQKTYDDLFKAWSDYEGYVEAKKQVAFHIKQVALARQTDPSKVVYWQSELTKATAKLQSEDTPKKTTWEQVVAAKKMLNSIKE